MIVNPTAGAPIVLALAFAGCPSNGRVDPPAAPRPVPLAQQFELAPGQSTRVDGLQVTFERVADDSRCPMDVQCVWEGDAVVVLSLRESTQAASAMELHTTGPLDRAGIYGRYRVRLVGLAPQPREGRPIPAGAYRATLLVTSKISQSGA